MNTKFKGMVQKGIQNPAEFIKLLIHLPKLIKLYYRLYQDRRVPFYLKLVLIGAFIYFIYPLDILPDFSLPVVGYVDDFIVIYTAFRFFLRKCPPEVVKEHIERIDQGL